MDVLPVSLSLKLQFTFSLKASLPVCHSKEMLLARKLNVNTNGYVPVKLKLQQPPPPGIPRELTLCCARGVGNLTVKVFAGVGNLKTACEGWGI